MENLNVKMHGAFTMTLVKENGEVETTHKDNIIVNTGFDLIAKAVFNAADRPLAANQIAVGSGSVAAAVGNTTLGSQVGPRGTATYTYTPGSKIVTLSYEFGPGVSTGALTEAGIFNATTGGTMLDRVVFPVINKGANDTLTTTFTLTMS
jgi:hypothetical protein